MNLKSHKLKEDIYYSLDYIQANLKDGQELFQFEFESDGQYLCNYAIKKKIEQVAGHSLKESIYDLETPYGYGGLLSNSTNEKFIDIALAEYSTACRKQNIIAEFFTMHPFNNFVIQNMQWFDFYSLDRKVVVVDLEKNKEERWSSYASKTRNILRKCERELTCEKFEDLDIFMKLYYQTMEKNNAGEFYFFNKEYFKKLFKHPSSTLLSVKHNDEVLSIGFFFFASELAHYHLSANKTDQLRLNANYFLLDQAFNIASSKGCTKFLLGGGRSNLPDDSLLRFKKKFSPDTIDFWIAGKVYNPKKYNELVKIWKKDNTDVKYFLKYRLDKT